MKFTKMHGIGNDYVYVNAFEETVSDPVRTAIYVSDRHFGIGSDGLILIKPNENADCEMDMYNLDGSRGKMCGNGIRCVAKYAYDHGIARKKRMTIATGSGLRTVDLTLSQSGDKAEEITVDMGSPIFEGEKIPVRPGFFSSSPIVNAPLTVNEKTYGATILSMGNPHCVIFLEENISALDLEKIGPAFEFHSAFPDRVNTEFVQVLDEHTVKMRVWERGSGETLACGTGACAVAVASILNKKVAADAPVVVKLLGGDLTITWDREKETVFMKGSATEVFHGEIALPWEE